MQKENNFTCRTCGTKMGGHHFYLHDRMCEDCFNKTYFPEADYEKAKREIEKERTNLKEEYREFLGKKETYFENKFKLVKYIEISPEEDNQKLAGILLQFAETIKPEKLIIFKLYDGYAINLFETDIKDIEKNLFLKYLEEDKEDIYISYSFSDLKSFYLVITEGMIFFSGNEETTKIIQGLLESSNIEYSLEETDEFSKSEEESLI